MTRCVTRHVLALAMTVFVATRVVSAQAPAGTALPAPGPPAQSDDQAPPPEGPPGDDLGTPRPAGVGWTDVPAIEPAASDDPSAADTSAFSTGNGVALSQRPFSGLFSGAAPDRSTRGHTLDLSGAVFGVHLNGDSLDAAGQPNVVTNGTFNYGGGGASLRYGHGWKNATIGAGGTASLAYMPDGADEGGDPWVDRWAVDANGAFNKTLGRKTNLSAGGAVDYTPYYQQDLLFQAAIPTTAAPRVGSPGLDFAIARNPSILTNINARLAYEVSRRGSLEAYYGISRRDFTEQDATSFFDQLAGGRYVYRLNNWVGVRAGYAYRTAQSGVPGREPFHAHELDAGLDGGYGRSFALTRRTTFSFDTNSSVMVDQRVSENGTRSETRNQSRLFVGGSASLLHAWARTWSTNVGAQRAVNYEVGFDRPILSNEVYAGLGGLLMERLDVRMRAAYSTGSVGFSRANSEYNTSSATADLRWALGRRLAAYATYFYYHYSFDAGVVLPTFVQRGLDRQGVTVGLSASLPLIGSRGRR
jgi:hypothetical protein